MMYAMSTRTGSVVIKTIFDLQNSVDSLKVKNDTIK